jgi:hypothetical protein
MNYLLISDCASLSQDGGMGSLIFILLIERSGSINAVRWLNNDGINMKAAEEVIYMCFINPNRPYYRFVTTPSLTHLSISITIEAGHNIRSYR